MATANEHTLPPTNLELPRTLHSDRHFLEEVQIPIVTISASFRSYIAEHRDETAKVSDEAVFSRAHFSMAMAIFEQASTMGLTSWLVDPINYVSEKDWKKIAFVESVGQLTARILILKKLKDFADNIIRSRLPIASAVEQPLLYVTEKTRVPILSLHYEVGNILAAKGKKVIQVVTDPHVRPHYLLEAQRSNITFCVFDQNTKDEFLEKAREKGLVVPKEKVVVTGPPVDPRIVKAREGKKPDDYKRRGLRLAFTTSGLGTNKKEIKKMLDQLLQLIKKTNIQLILYAGTHEDFRDMFYSLARNYKIAVGDAESAEQVRVIYKPGIVRANQDLIKYAFPWADGFITKPSGDMAYDAAAAGCFLLTLRPWGEWEENIEKTFEGLGISQNANVDNFTRQLEDLLSSRWVEKAMGNALNIDPLFLTGAKKIVDLQQKLAVK
ncbi:hypothetical protein CMO96_03920 [Candidatus Woesebacteria bacterium]|nr:hypothetical protein [Candidatus Woesebacteria bacterium]